MAARAAGASKIIRIDVEESKLNLAKDLRAHEIYNATDTDCVAQVRAATDGGVHLCG